MKRNRSAFTLIELLIVVAIIGILAAIAIPNFLAAQVRAKVSRALSDMRAIDTGLKQYRIDNNENVFGPGHPRWSDVTGTAGWWGVPCGLCPGLWLPDLTTPVEYMSTIPMDPFNMIQHLGEELDWKRMLYWYYVGYYEFRPERNDYVQQQGMWLLTSNGPDIYPFDDRGGQYIWGTNLPYDPTNGTISYGNIFRSELRASYMR